MLRVNGLERDLIQKMQVLNSQNKELQKANEEMKHKLICAKEYVQAHKQLKD